MPASQFAVQSRHGVAARPLVALDKEQASPA
jgi:hypothetical protein